MKKITKALLSVAVAGAMALPVAATSRPGGSTSSAEPPLMAVIIAHSGSRPRAWSRSLGAEPSLTMPSCARPSARRRCACGATPLCSPAVWTLTISSASMVFAPLTHRHASRRRGFTAPVRCQSILAICVNISIRAVSRI